jgi:hypothetical protein
MSFGLVTVGEASDAQTLTIRNSGDRPLSINAVSIEGSGAPNFTVDQVLDMCTGFQLAANGGSCTVGIRFTPIRTGAADARIRVEHDAYINPAQVAVSGTGR